MDPDPRPTKRLIAMRFSALGDVAMCVPVVKCFLEQNPDTELYFVSREFCRPMFGKIERLSFIAADLSGKHKGIFGLFRLVNELYREIKPLAIADLHNVLRTKTMALFFALKGVKTVRLNKNRRAKKELTRKKGKNLTALRPVTDYYADVFRRLHFPLVLDFEMPRKQLKMDGEIVKFTGGKKDGGWFGFAPFANYRGKTLPTKTIREIIASLSRRSGIKIFLFGGGKKEIRALKELEKLGANVYCAAGKFTFGQELQLISNLDIMISMDSANMHLASLYGIRTISIWGATHPAAGFLGFGQSTHDIVSVPVHCRPCSVFGSRKCYRKAPHMLECIREIDAQQVLDITG